MSVPAEIQLRRVIPGHVLRTDMENLASQRLGVAQEAVRTIKAQLQKDYQEVLEAHIRSGQALDQSLPTTPRRHHPPPAGLSPRSRRSRNPSAQFPVLSR